MSQEQARVFLEKMKTDDAFREVIVGIEDVDTKLEYINQKGFIFTQNELEVAALSMID